MNSPQSELAPLTQVERLVALLGEEHVALLLDLLEKIYGATGFGDITLIVAEHRIQNIRISESYRVDKKKSIQKD